MSVAFVAVGTAAAGIYGANKQAGAIRDGSRESAASADRAADLNMEQYQQSRLDASPWRQAGESALYQLMGLQGLDMPYGQGQAGMYEELQDLDSQIYDLEQQQLDDSGRTVYSMPETPPGPETTKVNYDAMIGLGKPPPSDQLQPGQEPAGQPTKSNNPANIAVDRHLDILRQQLRRQSMGTISEEKLNEKLLPFKQELIKRNPGYEDQGYIGLGHESPELVGLAGGDRISELKKLQNRRNFLQSKINPVKAGGQDQMLKMLEGSPDYKFSLDQGMKATNYALNKRGLLGSGRADKERMRFGSGLASQKLQDYRNSLAGLSGTGQTTSAQMGQLGASAAGTAGRAIMSAGDARASGYQAQGNKYANMSNLVTNAGNQYIGYQHMQKLLG